MKIKYTILIFLCFLTLKNLKADTTDVGLKVGVLPSVYYKPETRWAGGLFFYSYFRLNKNDTSSRKSNTQSYADYTQNKQFSIENDYQLFLNQGKVYLKGQLDYFNFPEVFYDIGNNSSLENKMLVEYKFLKFYHKTMFEAKKKHYIGAILDYQNQWDLSQKIMSIEGTRMVKGYNGFKAAGVGAIYLIDKRDNILNPEKGEYVELSGMAYENKWIGEYSFYNLTADIRKYYTFKNNLVLNLNFYASLNFGEVPLKHMPYLGGARFLRGYYAGRYRDNHCMLLQYEFRFPVYKRIGLALFGGTGEVASDLEKFSVNGLHYNYGFGLRYKIDKKENTNLRLDYGITKDQTGLYIVFAEAF
jgi:Omp85 superfamily domain